MRSPSASNHKFKLWRLLHSLFSENFASVVCSVTWPLNGSKAGGDLVLIQTSFLLLRKSSL